MGGLSRVLLLGGERAAECGLEAAARQAAANAACSARGRMVVADVADVVDEVDEVELPERGRGSMHVW